MRLKMGLKEKIMNIIYEYMKKVIILGNSDIRGTVYGITHIKVGEKGNLIMRENSVLNPFSTIRCLNYIEIQEDVLIAPFSFISDHQHNYKKLGIDRHYTFTDGKCIIEKGAWIGTGCTIINSVIGENSIIGANSTVINFNVPKNKIFVGDNRMDYKMRDLNLK